MKKIFLLALIAVGSCAFAQGVPAPATPRMQIDAAGTLVDDSHPIPTKVKKYKGYRIISTPDTIISLPANTKTSLVASLPTDITEFKARIYGGDIVTNCHTDLATFPYVVGDITASGAVFEWEGEAGAGNVFALPIASAATATIWGKW